MRSSQRAESSLLAAFIVLPSASAIARSSLMYTPRKASYAVPQLRHALLPGAVRTAEHRVPLLNTMANHLAATMRTLWCKPMNRTLEAVEGAGHASHCDREG